jgi:DNA-binding NarL/FixJ family response regulator
VIRAIVIADSGPVMARLTRTLGEVGGVDIVRHASGRKRVDALVGGCAPDLVVIDDMRWPPRALTRVAEVRRAAPDAAVVVLAERLEGSWLAEALRMGAAAVLPADTDPQTLRRVLHELSTPVHAAA